MVKLKSFHVINLFLVLCFLVVPALAQQQTEEDIPDKTFKIIKEYTRTNVKDQGRSNTCWCFSFTSFWESEALRAGKPEFQISEMFTVYHVYIEKAKAYVRMHGNNTFAMGALWHDAGWAAKNVGMVRDSDYNGLWKYEKGYNQGEMYRVLKGYLDAVISGGRGRGPSPKWLEGFKAILDVYMGKPPETIEVDGKVMTSKEYADQVVGLNMDDFISLTSFMHLPFYQQVELLVPDNWSHNDEFYNVPIDDLVKIVKYALENGYTLCYGGDISENTYYRGKYYAVWDEGKEITQEDREKMWDNWSTSDDHAMHIVGIAEDEEGTTFFLTKDSHAEGGPYKGYRYLSESWVRAKADSILVHKEGIPSEIREKLGIK